MRDIISQPISLIPPTNPLPKKTASPNDFLRIFTDFFDPPNRPEPPRATLRWLQGVSQTENFQPPPRPQEHPQSFPHVWGDYPCPGSPKPPLPTPDPCAASAHTFLNGKLPQVTTGRDPLTIATPNAPTRTQSRLIPRHARPPRLRSRPCRPRARTLTNHQNPLFTVFARYRLRISDTTA